MTAMARGRCVFGRVAGMKTAHASAGKDGAARGGAAGTAPRGMWLAVLLELSTLTVTQSCSQTLIQGVKEVHVPLKACVEVWIRNHPRAEGGRLSLRLWVDTWRGSHVGQHLPRWECLRCILETESRRQWLPGPGVGGGLNGKNDTGEFLCDVDLPCVLVSVGVFVYVLAKTQRTMDFTICKLYTNFIWKQKSDSRNTCWLPQDACLLCDSAGVRHPWASSRSTRPRLDYVRISPSHLVAR